MTGKGIDAAETPRPQNPGIAVPDTFKLGSADHNLIGRPKTRLPPVERIAEPPLGVLSKFQGVFAGRGFNLIFRPNSGPPTTTTFPNPVTPAPPVAPSENVLELNLTTETLTFSGTLGTVPNRGLQNQNDINLNGVPYVQAISDVTNVDTGKADGNPQPIHFEPGLWMHIPATLNDPVIKTASLSRMASIPHGTTINAQGVAPDPTKTSETPLKFPTVDISPFIIGGGKIPKFAAQTASNTVTPRLPQDLAKFIAAGTITQAILDDPNTILRNAVKGQNITEFSLIQVSTSPSSPELGGGTANIAFLEGTDGANNPNADAALMTANFWVETVVYTLTVPAWKPGDAALLLTPAAPSPDAVVPTFTVTPPKEITAPTEISVSSTQIQYSQIVNLNFAGLTWPHVSVATLVPQAPIEVPDDAFNN